MAASQSEPIRAKRLPPCGRGAAGPCRSDRRRHHPTSSAKLHAVIKRASSLDEEATDELVAKATEVEQKSIDLYHFTSLLNRSLDEAGRAASSK